jgi:hypothetical protein
VDTKNYNVNPYHFAYALNKPTTDATDFCATFLDAEEKPMKGFTLTVGDLAK